MIDSLSGLEPLGWLVLFVGACGCLVFLSFAWGAVREDEPRAAGIALGLATIFSLFFLIAGLFKPLLALPLLVGIALGGLAMVLPIGRPALKDDTPRRRIDERDIMFARWRLQPGTPEYTDYYARHPEHKQIDDRIRSAPGLLSPGSKLYHRLTFQAADASFVALDPLQNLVEGSVAAEPVAVDPAGITTFVKGLALYHGAHSVGVTRLQDYHLYSHVGRGAGVYGEPIVLKHQYAIAVTLEMDYDMVRRAPTGPALMETSRQYLAAATIATQLAVWIRSLGYSARAHIDGNYRVVCPLVARDAGLGEIGRMGLLMTPDLGPRVRLAVVTTDLSLIPDERRRDPSMIAFCQLCKKCADNCPSRSIPFQDQQSIEGVERWQINSETCFMYWSVMGTDCGRCLAVCPYSHPDNWLHNGVRWAIRRSAVARWVALQMDDLFYGRKPKMLPWAEWMQDGGIPNK